MKVYLRDDTDADGQLLGEAPIADADQLVRLVRAWGVRTPDGYAGFDSVSGGFVYGEGATGFEIVFEVTGQ